MEIKFNVTGTKRKALVDAISQHTGCAAEYKGAPSFAYEVSGFTIGRDGTLTGDVTQELLNVLAERGFAVSPVGAAQTEMPDTLVIEIPRDGFTDTAISNLEKLIESKGALIKHALGVAALPIELAGEKISFPWFEAGLPPDEVSAYTGFIAALCKMAKGQTRVTARVRAVENEKYAFRCFLLRLGFIGAEHKELRKILLSRLSGDGSFKCGHRKESDDDNPPEATVRAELTLPRRH